MPIRQAEKSEVRRGTEPRAACALYGGGEKDLDAEEKEENVKVDGSVRVQYQNFISKNLTMVASTHVKIIHVSLKKIPQPHSNDQH